MAQHKISVVATSEPDLTLVEAGLEGLDYEFDVSICRSDGETIEAIKGSDVIVSILVPMPREVVEEIDTARAIICGSHGFDRIDHEAATEKDVMVVNSAGFCTEEVSNHTMMFVLACAKSLVLLDKKVRAGGWRTDQMPVLPPIDGQTMGIVGLGNIGRATARKAQAFGLDIISYDPYIAPWTAKEYRVEMVGSLEELASRSDYASVLVPLNSETRGMIGESFFNAMKPTAYFINTCRGPTVDEAALVRTLSQRRIAGAALDVFEQEPPAGDNPLFKMDNVMLTPHSAGTSTASSPAALIRLGEETARVLRGTWPMSLVNPEVRSRIPSRPTAKAPRSA
jgi:D-3-phosphoglycerate dehydrogenase